MRTTYVVMIGLGSAAIGLVTGGVLATILWLMIMGQMKKSMEADMAFQMQENARAARRLNQDCLDREQELRRKLAAQK